MYRKHKIKLKEYISIGLVAGLECALINFVFNELGLEKLNCEVVETI